MGNISEKMGRLYEAEANHREALQRALACQSPIAAQAYRCLAFVYREWNDLASARLFVDQAIESSLKWGHADSLARDYLALASICQAQHNLAEADHALAEASQAIRGHGVEAFTISWLGAARARLCLAQGKLDDARRWARGLGQEGQAGLGNEVEQLTLVRLLLAEQRVDEAICWLSHLQSAMEATGRQGNLIEVLVLRATAWNMQADTRSALAVLEQALRLARSEGYTRVFLDEGRPIETLLRIGATEWEKALCAYARKLLVAFYDDETGHPVVAAETVQAESPIEPLSERELEVLHLIAAGCSNRDIADRLVISVRTVKKHVENIHGKLGVRNRTQAAARARELNLL